MVQLADSFPEDALNADNYGRRSGLEASMIWNLKCTAHRLKRLAGLSDGDTVIDIGANDGGRLRSYRTSGSTWVSIDPTIAKIIEYHACDVNSECVADFFHAANFDAVSSQRASVVMSIVISHKLEDPVAFANDILQGPYFHRDLARTPAGGESASGVDVMLLGQLDLTEVTRMHPTPDAVFAVTVLGADLHMPRLMAWAQPRGVTAAVFRADHWGLGAIWASFPSIHLKFYLLGRCWSGCHISFRCSSSRVCSERLRCWWQRQETSCDSWKKLTPQSDAGRFAEYRFVFVRRMERRRNQITSRHLVLLTAGGVDAISSSRQRIIHFGTTWLFSISTVTPTKWHFARRAFRRSPRACSSWVRRPRIEYLHEPEVISTYARR